MLWSSPRDRENATGPAEACRALKAAGIAVEDVCGQPGQALAQLLVSLAEPVWLVRAGAWPCTRGPIVFPPPARAGQSLVGLGLVRTEAGSKPSIPSAGQISSRGGGPPGLPAPQPGRPGGPPPRGEILSPAPWIALQRESGGDFSSFPCLEERLPPIVSAFLDGETLAQLARRLAVGEDLATALHAEAASVRNRVIRWPALDVYHHAGLRVLQVVTSLQQGGAERLALSLTNHLCSRGIQSLLLVLGRPTRAAFPAPPGTIDLSPLRGDRRRQVGAVSEAALAFAADLFHVHLLSSEEMAGLAALGLPLVATVHNVQAGWPPGLEALRPTDATLLLACAQAVEADLRTATVPLPVRTAWNGIDLNPYVSTPDLRAAAREVRHRLDLEADDFLLLALANPRPQKRLDRLPAVLAATRAALSRQRIDRQARLILVGDTGPGTSAAVLAMEALRAEIARLGLEAHVRLAGSAGEVAPLLAAADVLVSVSAFEGLSLAHLEALAAGLPVVATAVGGTAEVAQDNPAVFLLAPEARAEQFAEVLVQIATARPEGGPQAVAKHFSRERFLERHAWVYPRAIEAVHGPRQGDGLLLVSNNFSTGGAQSSGRRLLLGLAAEGIRVRAAVLQEHPDHPTPGRRILRAAGIPVLVLPPAGEVDAADAVAVLLETIDAERPASVLLWNVIPEYKVLLADALLDVPLFDVSPGEMFYESLER